MALWRSDRYRRRLGQRQCPNRRLAGIRDALCPIRVSLPLRLRDDLRIGFAVDVAHMEMMFGGHLLSLLIWLPIIGGFVVLGLGERIAVAKWLSLAVSGAALLLSVPLWTAFRLGTAAMQFVERSPW